MTLKLEVGTFASPGATGNQTTSLVDTGFGTVKALIVWTSAQTAAGDTDGDGMFSMGLGSYRGAVAQQWCRSFFSDDGVGTSDTARGMTDASILRWYSAATPTVDVDAALVSLGDAQFVINWTDLPASAVRVNYLALGGDEITDALVTTFAYTTGTGNLDVTVAAGFGNPDLLVNLGSNGGASALPNDNAGNAFISFGAGKDDSNQAATSYDEDDAVANMELGVAQRSSFVLQLSSDAALALDATLNARASWPTDGFQINKVTAPGANSTVGYLALRGTFTAVVGSGTVPTSGTPPVTQDLAVGATPRGAIFFHNVLPATAGIDNTHADLGLFGLGALDGTHEAWAGVGNDDGNTTSIAHRNSSETKAIKMFTPSASGTLTSEADGLISGNDVRLSWNDIEASIAREYRYVLLGDVAANALRRITLAPSYAVQRASRW